MDVFSSDLKWYRSERKLRKRNAEFSDPFEKDIVADRPKRCTEVYLDSCLVLCFGCLEKGWEDLREEGGKRICGY